MSQQTTNREAMRAALRTAMRNDERVFLMGEDVGAYGGCFAVSMGLMDELGEDRVRDTPLSEAGFTGAGIGAALGGMRPIVEIMTINFALLALDQVVNTAAVLRHMSGGQCSVPLVIRIASGGGKRIAAQHSHSFEGWFAHIPGIKVVAPAMVEDFRWMLETALADPDPVVIIEHALLYGRGGELPSEGAPVDLETARVRRDGEHVSLISYGLHVHTALAAAEELAKQGVSAEVLDLRSLRPLDEEAILATVKKTGRAVIVDEMWKTGSLAGELSAMIMEGAFYDLEAPVQRVCSAEVPMPYAGPLEDACLPSVEDVVHAALAAFHNTV